MNDIGRGATAQQISSAVQQIIDRVHAKGLMGGGPVHDGIESLKPEFVCDDAVHPNSAGHKAMGELVDLALFRAGNRRR